jgi:hypothetical protein
MKTDSLKLVDMMWLDEEITSCLPLRRAWGEEEIFLDYWGRYDQVFAERPNDSISSRELLQPEEEGTFLLLQSEHVDLIIKSLYSHIDELNVMTKEQLGTLEKWKSLSLANHRHMVAYIFNRGEERGATVARIQPLAAVGSSITNGIKQAAGANGRTRLEVKIRNLQFISVPYSDFLWFRSGRCS